jgi:hypothetical protein
MSAHRWSILFLVLAGACVTAEAPGQLREASREDNGSHAIPYSGPGSFSDASLRPIGARGSVTALFAPDKEETAQMSLFFPGLLRFAVDSLKSGWISAFWRGYPRFALDKRKTAQGSLFFARKTRNAADKLVFSWIRA